MRLYMIRHGESTNNETGCYTGWLQPSLTKKGIEDAKSVRPFISGIHFDKVYTSDLIRAKQTAEIALPHCSYEETALLREIDLGTLSGKNIADAKKEYGEQLAKCSAGLDYTPYGGENRTDITNRIKRFLDTVASSEYNYVAAFSHVGALRTILDVILNINLPRDVIYCKNCTIAILEYKGCKWYLDSWINLK